MDFSSSTASHMDFHRPSSTLSPADRKTSLFAFDDSHSLDAAILATVLVGALRNARRRGVGLAEQAKLADAALSKYVDGGAFVTG